MAGKKHLDARQAQFISKYFGPTSKTYLNAYRSALAAGYKKEYAENITSQMPMWLSEQLGYRNRVVTKAKNRLESFLEEDNNDKRVQSDMVKFTLKTLGKDEGFTERNETLNRNINVNLEITDEEFKSILQGYKVNG